MLFIGPVKQNNLLKIAIIFLFIIINICSGCSKEPSHRNGSFEYPQHMFWLRNKKDRKISFSYALLSGGPVNMYGFKILSSSELYKIH